MNISLVIPVYSNLEEVGLLLKGINTLKFELLLLIPSSLKDVCCQLKKHAKKNKNIHVVVCKEYNLALMRNKGIDLAKGEYILFTTPEDHIFLDNLEKAYIKAKAVDSDILLCFSDYYGNFLDNVSIREYIRQNFLGMGKSISAEEISSVVFNFPSYFVNRSLYKRTFLRKNGLYFQLQNTIEDTTLSFVALLRASKIYFYDRNLVKPDSNYQTPSEFSLERSWKEKTESVFYLERELKKEEKYEIFEKSFINYALDAINVLLILKEPIKSFFKNYVKTKLIPYFHLSEREKDYYYNQQNYYAISEYETLNTSIPIFEKVFFEKKENIIPICFGVRFSSDVFNISVAIESIKKNSNPFFFYDIYLFYHPTFPIENFSCLEGSAPKNMKISFIRLSDDISSTFLSYYEDDPFYLPFVADLIWGYKKILWLNNDSIVNGDISQLFKVPMNKNIIAGVKSVESFDYVENKMGLIHETFIDQDVLLVNLDALHEKNNQFWNCVGENKNIFKKVFRDALNKICFGNIFVLDNKWNTSIQLLSEKNHKIGYPYKPDEIYIINYKDTKPWIDPGSIFANIWWKYARKSPFYERLLYYYLSGKIKKHVSSSKSNDNAPKMMTEGKENGFQLSTEDKYYFLMKKYIKETFYSYISWGEKRKFHKEQVKILTEEIKKYVEQNKKKE